MKRIVIIAIAAIILTLASCTEQECKIFGCASESPVKHEQSQDEFDWRDVLPDWLFTTDSIKWE